MHEQYPHKTISERAYTTLAGAHDVAPHHRRNFLLNIVHGGTTTLAGKLASPSLILPLLMTAIAAPTVLFGLLMPVFKASVLLPQLALSGQMRAFKKRKWIWIATALTRAPILLLMIAATLLLPPYAAGVALVVLTGLYGIAVSLGVLSFLDVVAKTIPAGQRGLLLARRASFGGIITLGMGLLVQTYGIDSASVTPYLVLLGGAALMWFVAAAIVAGMVEHNGETAARRNPLHEVRAGIDLLRRFPGFRHYISTRALLLIIELTIPFFALGILRFTTAERGVSLGLYMIAVALAEILSNGFWARHADRDSRLVLSGAAAISALSGLGVLLISALPLDWRLPVLYAIPFLGINFAFAGVRLGADTYLIDSTPDTDRPMYVALSNTVIGVVGLLGALLGGIASVAGLHTVFVILIVIAGAGALAAWSLPESMHMLETDARRRRARSLRQLIPHATHARR